MSARLYNLVQRMAGDRTVQRHLAPYFATLPPRAVVMDLGGGTGLSRQHLTDARYVCLDLDAQKLSHVPSAAIIGDGAHCPLAAQSVDAVLCAKVIHHLDPRAFALVLAEIRRVLKPGGLVIVADAVRSRRWLPRLLWRCDRGAYPRTDRELSTPFQRTFTVTATERFRAGVFHDFVILAGRTPAAIRYGAQAR